MNKNNEVSSQYIKPNIIKKINPDEDVFKFL